MKTRKPYPSDVADEEWACVAPYLALVRADAPQRRHDLRDVFDALRYPGADRRPVPDAAARLRAVGGGLLADPPLAGG